MKDTRSPLIWILVICLSCIIFIFVVFRIVAHFNPGVSSATSTSTTVSTQEKWDLGSKSNIATDSGSLKIDNKGGSDVDLTGPGVALSTSKANSDYEGTTADLIDGNTSTYWGVHGTLDEDCGPQGTLVIDLGLIAKVNDVKVYFDYKDGGTAYYSVSSDNITYNSIGDGGATGEWTTKSANQNARYIKIVITPLPCFGKITIGEIQVTSDALGTHITGATQIDGGENFWNWDASTITQDVPENTTASYQYRTSSNGSDWTGWVGSIDSVTSRVGEDDDNPTRYRYLQIKATLTNSDGVSTPTIGSYEIDYHTEVKPNAPTAQTATVQ